jgi:hypothetical protein
VIYALAWIIGICNPLSALLVGPWLARRVAWARKAQGVGWALLALAQVAFLAFGFASQLDGFRFAQPLMIPLALMNFAAWLSMRRPSARSAEAGARAVQAMAEGMRVAQVAEVLLRMDAEQQRIDDEGDAELAWYYYREEVEDALGLPSGALDSADSMSWEPLLDSPDNRG